jgi:SAM-dependent methyltransferase
MTTDPVQNDHNLSSLVADAQVDRETEERKEVEALNLDRDQRLHVILAEYTALRAELMFYMNSIHVNHQLIWTLILAEVSALVYMEKVDHRLLLLAFFFGAPVLVILLLLRSAAYRASLLVLADYIHKGIKWQIKMNITSRSLRGAVFEWEEHKARSHRVQRTFLKVLDISPWGSFYVAFIVSLLLGLYVGNKDSFFEWNSTYLILSSSTLCAVGIGLTSYFAWRYNVTDSEARHARTSGMGKEENHFRYAVKSINTAKAIILTPEGETGTDERWTNESVGVLEVVAKYIPRGGCVLDFGMGIGRVLRALSEKRSDLRLIGVDSSPNMRKLAQKYLGSRGFDIRPDISEVLFESVDFACAIYVLQHVTDHLIEAVIDDLYQVLKPGGHLFIIDNKRRVVPIELEVERTARQEGQAFVDHAILKIARNEHTDEAPWKDDGILVMDLLKRRFGSEPQIIEPNPKWFCDDVRTQHVFAVFKK